MQKNIKGILRAFVAYCIIESIPIAVLNLSVLHLKILAFQDESGQNVVWKFNYLCGIENFLPFLM